MLLVILDGLAARVSAEETEELQPAGCMDETADNYDELAAVDDGTCLYQGDSKILPCCCADAVGFCVGSLV